MCSEAEPNQLFLFRLKRLLGIISPINHFSTGNYIIKKYIQPKITIGNKAGTQLIAIIDFTNSRFSLFFHVRIVKELNKPETIIPQPPIELR